MACARQAQIVDHGPRHGRNVPGNLCANPMLLGYGNSHCVTLVVTCAAHDLDNGYAWSSGEEDSLSSRVHLIVRPDACSLPVQRSHLHLQQQSALSASFAQVNLPDD